MKIFGFDDYQVLNESFKSDKLRNIIQQHGMPKYEQDRKFLYDLQDDEILGVMDFDEWYDFHRDNKNSYHITLEDGKYLVLGNIDTLKYYADDEDFQKEFKKRRDERHPGNELNDVPSHEKKKALEDRFTKHFREKKEELLHRRNLEELKTRLGDNLEAFAKEIREWFESNISEKSGELISEYKDKIGSVNLSDGFEIKFLDNTYDIDVDYDLYISDGYKRYGAMYYDLSVSLKTMYVYDEITEDSFEVKELFDDTSDLLKEYSIDDVEGEITDYYSYYGVSRGDFF